MDICTSFIRILIFSDRALEYGDDGVFRLMRWMQNVTSKRGTMKCCMLTDVQVVNNF
jgi:hypothetical protein